MKYRNNKLNVITNQAFIIFKVIFKPLSFTKILAKPLNTIKTGISVSSAGEIFISKKTEGITYFKSDSGGKLLIEP